MNTRCPTCGSQEMHPAAYDRSTCWCAVCGKVSTYEAALAAAGLIVSGVLRAEPILAWRLWAVAHVDQVSLSARNVEEYSRRIDAGENPLRNLLGWRLAGVGTPLTWTAPTVDAVCHHHPAHRPPTRFCGCGVWAVPREQLQRAFDQYGHEQGLLAAGKVQMWGRYLRHEHGWRAEHARPYEITLIRNTSYGVDVEAAAAGLRSFYRCDVRTSFVGELPYGLTPPNPRRLEVNIVGSFGPLQQQFLQVQQAIAASMKSMQRSLPKTAAALNQALAPGRERREVVATKTRFAEWSREVARFDRRPW